MNINEKKFTDHIKLLFIFLCITIIHSSVSYSDNILRNMVEDTTLTGERLPEADPNVLLILDLSGSMRDQDAKSEVGNWDGSKENNSKRMDLALSVLLDVLDSNNSLDNEVCIDASGLWSNTPGEDISCRDFLYTPYRNVSDYIYDGGDISENNYQAINLPLPSGKSIRELLTDEDAEILNFNILPMKYSGEPGLVCQFGYVLAQESFTIANGGFQGGDAEAINRIWDFYRHRRPHQGTPLALTLGFDDTVNLPPQTDTSDDQTEYVVNDALLAFHQDMPNDPALGCRPEFVIVITDGEDTCTGDCVHDQYNCAYYTSNANRRSSINAVSKLRTYFSRNPVTSTFSEIETVNKEVLTFVIGIDIDNPNSKRSLNAMALAGGTHTKGIINHTDPSTDNEIGTVSVEPLEGCIDLSLDINHKDNLGKSAICGSENDGLDVFRAIGRGDGIGFDSGIVRNCGNGSSDTPYINGACTFGPLNEAVFENQYFDEGLHADGTTPLDLSGFAFFASNPEELTAAIKDILSNINTFTTTGVAPSAPQTAGNVTLRDRMFLALTNPLVDESLWAGRLALYSFVDDPNVEGRKLIVRKPGGSENYTTTSDLEQYSIFTDGKLNENAIEYHWEAGGILANRAPDSRNIYTVGTGTFDIDISASGVIRYTGIGKYLKKTTRS